MSNNRLPKIKIYQFPGTKLKKKPWTINLITNSYRKQQNVNAIELIKQKSQEFIKFTQNHLIRLSKVTEQKMSSWIKKCIVSSQKNI